MDIVLFFTASIWLMLMISFIFTGSIEENGYNMFEDDLVYTCNPKLNIIGNALVFCLKLFSRTANKIGHFIGYEIIRGTIKLLFTGKTSCNKD